MKKNLFHKKFIYVCMYVHKTKKGLHGKMIIKLYAT